MFSSVAFVLIFFNFLFYFIDILFKFFIVSGHDYQTKSTILFLQWLGQKKREEDEEQNQCRVLMSTMELSQLQ